MEEGTLTPKIDRDPFEKDGRLSTRRRIYDPKTNSIIAKKEYIGDKENKNESTLATEVDEGITESFSHYCIFD